MRNEKMASLLMAVLLLLLASCGNPTGSTAGDPSDIDGPGANGVVDSYFWGWWQRMDNSDRWHFADRSVERHAASAAGAYSAAESVSTFAATSTALSAAGRSFARQSDNVIKVSDAGSVYLLFRMYSRSSSLRGRVVGFLDGSRGLGGSTGLMSIRAIVANLANVSDVKEATTDADGLFTVEGLVPGDGRKVRLVDPVTGKSAEVNIGTTVDDGADVGNIAFVTEGFSFKTTCAKGDPFLFADRFNACRLAIRIENVGNAACAQATYRLEPAPALRLYTMSSGALVEAPLEGILRTIEPGSVKTLELWADCASIGGEELEDEDIAIYITDNSGVNGRTWEDHVAVRAYRAPLAFRAYAAQSALRGVLISPDAEAIPFSVASGKSLLLDIPWRSSDYRLVFSGASAATETAYSFNLDASPATDFTGWSDVRAFEGASGNDGEESATVLGDLSAGPPKAYLGKNDIDFYRLPMPASAPPVPGFALVGRAIVDPYGKSGDLVTGNGDGRASPGESLWIDLEVCNRTMTSRDLGVTLSTTSPHATVTKASVDYGVVGGGMYQTAANATGLVLSYGSPAYAAQDDSKLKASAKTFALSVAATAPVGTSIPVTATFSDGLGNTWQDGFEIPVERTGAAPEFLAFKLYDELLPPTGYTNVQNKDGKANPGEWLRMDIRVRNAGTSEVFGLATEISSDSPYIAITDGRYAIDSSGHGVEIRPGYYWTCDSLFSDSADPNVAMVPSTSGFEFHLDPATPVGIEIPMTISFADAQGNTWTDSFALPVARSDAKVTVAAKAFSAAVGADLSMARGTTGYMDIRIRNEGTSDSPGLTAKLSVGASGAAYLSLGKSEVSFVTLRPGYYATASAFYSSSTNPDLAMSADYSTYGFSLASNAPVGSTIPLVITLADAQGMSWTESFELTVK